MAVEPQVQQFIDFIRDEMPRRIKTNPNNLPNAEKLLVSVQGTLEVIYKTLAELDIAIKSDVDTALSSKEPTITAGTSAQYYRGDKTFQPLNTNAVTESTDKRYLSDAQKTIATQAATSTLSGYLSSTDWSTFNGKQAALTDVVTADTYGSSTQWPKVTVNTKGIVTGIELQTVPTPTLTDATFSVQKNGSPSIAASWDLTALTASHVHTYPNKDINFGDLPSVATNDTNSLSGTAVRCRILGGQNNTVSGTDNLALGCTYTTLNSTNVVAVGCTGFDSYALAIVQKAGVVLGTSLSPAEIIALTANYGAAAGAVQCLFTSVQSANGTTRNVTFDGSNTASNTNCVKLLAAGGALGGAVHDVDFLIAVGASDPLVPVRTIFAKRRVYVNNNGTTTTSVITIDTDTSVGTAATGAVTIGVTTDIANNRLIPTVNATSGSGQTTFQVSCRVTSHFNRK